MQDMVSAANVFYACGTHRSPQCRGDRSTPGPGAYRTPCTFPMSQSDEAPGQRVHRASPAWKMAIRTRGRVADICNPFSIVPPVVALFRKEAGEAPGLLLPSRITINTMPPVSSSAEILKGHGGDVPRGYGFPF